MEKQRLNFEQLDLIAKAGFTERVLPIIEYKKLQWHIFGDVYRLFDPDYGFKLALPEKTILSITYLGNDWVSFDSKGTSFNQLAAMKKMADMNLIIPI